MDGYPQHLAPEFHDSGAVKTPFDEWWARASKHFSAVPPSVARQWLHRHWGYSPFGFLTSARYTFVEEDWPSQRLTEVRSYANDWDYDLTLRQGKQTFEQSQSWVAVRMRELAAFPEPMIVFDNRTRQLDADPSPRTFEVPGSFVVIEGHTRFELASWMIHLNRFAPKSRLWVMQVASP